MKRPIIWLCLLMLLIASPVWSATYWVSKQSTGSPGCNNSATPLTTTAKLTIQAGIACLSVGDTLNVRAGTYSEPSQTFNNLVGTTWNSPTTIQAASGETVIWTTTSNMILGINNTRYAIIKGIIFDGTTGTNNMHNEGPPTKTTVPVPMIDRIMSLNYTNGSDPNTAAKFIRVQNNVFRNSAFAAVQVCLDCNDFEFLDNEVTQIGLVEVTAVLYLGAPRSFIIGNYFHDINGTILNYWNQNNIGVVNDGIARENRFERFARWWGETSQNGSDHDGSPSTARHVKNTYNTRYGGGIAVTRGDRGQVYNNWFIDGPSAITAGAGTRDCLIANNTINSHPLGAAGNVQSNVTGSISVSGDGFGTTGCLVRNNIVYQPGVTNPPPIFNTGGSTNIFSNNLCSSAVSGLCQVVGNPQFVSATNLQLTPGSPAINTGATLSQVTTDFAGIPRPQPPGGLYDIGAYEFALAPQPDGPPSAQYTFDNTTADSTSGDHDGALIGGATFEAPGIIGTHALRLTANGDYMTVPSSSAFRTQSWCLSTWINMSAMDTGGCVWAGVGEEYGGFITPAGNATCYIQGTSSYVEPASSTNVLSGTNRHLACTYDGTTLRSYVDGLQVASSSGTSYAYSGTEALRIGAYPPGGAFNCKGRMDHVYVYPQSCSPAAILNLFNEQPPAPGLAVSHQQWYQANAAPGQAIGGPDTPLPNHVVTTPLGIRWSIHKGDTGSLTEYFKPYCRVFSSGAWGAWTEVVNSFGTLGVRFLADSAVSLGQATSVLLPTDTFTGIAGLFLENPVDTTSPYDAIQRMTIAQGQHAELEARVEFDPSLAGKQVECRPQRETGAPFDSYQLQSVNFQPDEISFALMIGTNSPAFNAAPCLGAVTTDIRGITRPQGAVCDIGAYEVSVSGSNVASSRTGGQAIGGAWR